MITACKAESKNEEAHDKVSARSAMTTEPAEGTTGLGNQIAKLMATLTRTGQGNSPASAPNSPGQRGHGRGQTDRNTPGHPSSYNDQTGLGQIASVCSASVRSGTVTTTTGGQGPNTQGSKEDTWNMKGPQFPPVLQVLRLGPHGLGMCHPNKDFKPVQREPSKCGPPPLAPAKTVNSRPLAFPLWPKPKPTTMKVTQKKGWPEVTTVPFLNPDPIAHLVGCSNEAPVIVDGQEMTTLIYSGAQVSSSKLQVLWGSCTADPAPESVIGTRGGQGVLPPQTLDLWRSTSRSWGLKTKMRMCCCWSYQPWSTLRWSWSWLDPKS